MVAQTFSLCLSGQTGIFSLRSFSLVSEMNHPLVILCCRYAGPALMPAGCKYRYRDIKVKPRPLTGPASAPAMSTSAPMSVYMLPERKLGERK